MLRDAVRFLICPHCGQSFVLENGSLRCVNGHTFDIARQGYVNLLRPGSKPAGTGDTARMVAARDAFLSSGDFAALANVIAEETVAAHAGVAGDVCVADVGAGTGYFLAAALDALTATRPLSVGVALDVSRYSARRAAKAHPRAGSVLCDAWAHLPLRDASVGVMLNVFAPRNGPQMRRVLHPDGALVVVTPTRRHLGELVSRLHLLSVDERKEERLAATLGADFELMEQTPCEFVMALSHQDALALVEMGPSAWHSRGDEWSSRIAKLPEPLQTTASVTVSTYRPAGVHRLSPSRLGTTLRQRAN